MSFLSVDGVAYRLGIPTSWLRQEAQAGRVPALRIGRRLVMDLEAVRTSLVWRSVDDAEVRRDYPDHAHEKGPDATRPAPEQTPCSRPAGLNLPADLDATTSAQR